MHNQQKHSNESDYYKRSCGGAGDREQFHSVQRRQGGVRDKAGRVMEMRS